jgi:hypothetical protein
MNSVCLTNSGHEKLLDDHFTVTRVPAVNFIAYGSKEAFFRSDFQMTGAENQSNN